MSDFFPDSFVENLKSNADIVSIISDYVELKKSGAGYKGRCPFHSEKTPSFNVNNDKGMFYCFGCGAGGDVFAFVQRYEKVDFPEAVRIVASKSGVPLPQIEQKGPGKAIYDKLKEITFASHDYFRKILLDSRRGEKALGYLKSREIKEETINMMEIGFAPPGWDNLMNFLSSKGFTPEDIKKAGLIVKNEEKQRYYDRFRNRIIFPIKDVNGKIIAFGGRDIGDDEPKYLNSPETLLYSKSSNIYCINEAKESLKEKEYGIIVEGYFDCIRLHQEGITNAVASLGTAFSEGHAKLLRRFTKKVIVNFDPDPAGITAAKRSFEILLAHGFSVNCAILPGGEDPDDFVRNNGAEYYRKQLKHSVPFMDFIIDEAVSTSDLFSASGRIEALNTVLPYLSRLANRIERMDYLRTVSDKLKIEDAVLISEVKKALQSGKRKIDLPEHAQIIRATPAEEGLLRMVMGDEKFLVLILNELEPFFTNELNTNGIWKTIRSMAESGEPVNFKTVTSRLETEADQSLLSRISFSAGFDLSEEQVTDNLNSIKLLKLNSEMKMLQKQIEQASLNNDRYLCDKLSVEKEKLRKKIDEIS